MQNVIESDAEDTYPAIQTIREATEDLQVGDSLKVPGPEDRFLKIFRESIKGRGGYRVVFCVPGKGHIQHANEKQHYELSRHSTFQDSLMEGYSWMGLDPIAHL
jgi:acetyl esterase/lipase